MKRHLVGSAMVAIAIVVAAGLLTEIGSRTKSKPYEDNKITPVVVEQDINASGGADTNFTLPADCVSFSINERTAAIATRLSYASGGIAADDYITIPAGERYVEENIDPDGSATTTIYLRSDGSASTVEIVTWLGQ